jgi:hypothetical protein
MNILLGVVGKPRTGKDSVGKYLVQTYGFHSYAFADYLKFLASEYFKFPNEVLWGPKTRESREFLQNLGSLLTALDSNIFIDKVVNKIHLDYENSKIKGIPFRAVITDVRREDELSLFSKTGLLFVVHSLFYKEQDSICSGVCLKNIFEKMMVILLERPLEKCYACEEGLDVTGNHPIEKLSTMDIKWDYYINNSSDLIGMHKKVDQMMKFILDGDIDDSNQREPITNC